MVLETGSSETLPRGLEVLEMPYKFWKICDRMSTEELRPGVDIEIPVEVVSGFEDVLGELLGNGLFFNTPGTVHQLGFAISISNHSIVQEVLNNKDMAPRDVIKTFRANKILSGMKIMDLGCGKPNFALAAHALGAQMYTSDVNDLKPEYKRSIERHVVIDLNQHDVIEILQDTTGGNFDLVSESIYGGVPGQSRHIKTPQSMRIVTIGNALLKPGGYLDYSLGVAGFKDTVLRKKLG